MLAEAVDAGEIDLAVIEEPVGRPIGECLSIERLVWVGCKGGEAYRKRPLPISIVSDTCAFRPVVFEALRRARDDLADGLRQRKRRGHYGDRY